MKVVRTVTTWRGNAAHRIASFPGPGMNQEFSRQWHVRGKRSSGNKLSAFAPGMDGVCISGDKTDHDING